MQRIKQEQGFTLIEIIAVLVLVGMLAVVAGTGLTFGVRGYLLAAENAEITQKAELVLSRLSRELRVCHNCDAANPINLDSGFNFDTGNVNLGLRRLEYNAGTGQLLLGTSAAVHPLVDGLTAFSLAYQSDGRVLISLTMQHQQAGSPQVFQTMILPRNTPR